MATQRVIRTDPRPSPRPRPGASDPTPTVPADPGEVTSLGSGPRRHIHAGLILTPTPPPPYLSPSEITPLQSNPMSPQFFPVEADAPGLAWHSASKLGDNSTKERQAPSLPL